MLNTRGYVRLLKRAAAELKMGQTKFISNENGVAVVMVCWEDDLEFIKYGINIVA